MKNPYYNFMGSSISLVCLFLELSLAVSQTMIENIPTTFPHNYANISKLIIDTAVNNAAIGNLEYVCDTFGPRYRGTPNLDMALNWVMDEMKSQGLDNVRGEKVVNITNWVRGDEHLHLLEPRFHKMTILGLGRSVGTGPHGIEADVFVVSTFDELKANASLAQGKIVLFNAPFVTYGQTVAYRISGASEAAKVGAVAALVRSITPFSLNTPHTGEMAYEDGVPQIPTAAVTIEDAEMLARMQARGNKIRVKLYMEATTKEPVTSQNVLAELEGATNPEEIILMGGHSDSWDVGTGAMDDGGGFFSSWEAVHILSTLVQQGKIPRPKRTIRAILWVDEEISQRGAATYLIDHQSELANHVIAMESDSGNFVPTGFGFSGSKQAFQILEQIGSVLLSPIGAGNITYGEGADTDNGPLCSAGVPCASFQSEGFIEDTPMASYYFFYHHSNADTITALNIPGLKLSVAAYAVFAYVIADMDQTLPRSQKFPVKI